MNVSQTPAPSPFRRELHSRIAEFSGLAQALRDWGLAQGVTGRVMHAVELILDELFTNVVMHGYRDDPSGDITVEARVQEGQVQVVLTDHAPAFNPLDAPEPDTSLDIEARAIGGLGLLFVRRSADTLDYQDRDTQGRPANVVRFGKRVA